MKIVVGLGNPGDEYEYTRHNAGWLFLSFLESKYGFKINEKKKNLDSIVSQIYIDGKKVLFVKPQTFMNLSGIAVQKVKKWYDVEDKDILVVFDDIDIPFGEFRYKLSGSGGTHNGMKSIVSTLNSKQMPRLRIGIGNLKHEKQDMADFVLQRFSKNELEVLGNVFSEAFEKFTEFLDN